MATTQDIPIADLVPYESGAVRSAVDSKRKSIEKGEALDPVDVVVVDEVRMVRDGTNTTVAHLELGHTTVACTVDTLPQSDYPSFRDTLALRQKKGQLGFQRFPVLPSDGDRGALTKNELKEMTDGDSWDELAKALKKK
jgi:hypothetical protein